MTEEKLENKPVREHAFPGCRSAFSNAESRDISRPEVDNLVQHLNDKDEVKIRIFRKAHIAGSL